MIDLKPDVTIIGGSLTGLTLALACAARGLPVHVVERAGRRLHGGDSLSIDCEALAAAVGYDPRQSPTLPVVPGYRDLTTWSALHGWLYERAAETLGVSLEEGRNVRSIEALKDRARISFADGGERYADAVIGADGYNSIVRRAIAPEQPFARYAGYIVWRGLVEESALSRHVPWPSHGGLWIDFIGGYRLVAAVLPGRDGSVEIGHRQITFAWFDTHQEALLRRKGCLTDEGFIVGTLARGTIEAEVREELEFMIPALWPDIWTEAVKVGVRSAAVLSGAPIAEYKPERLALGPLAIIGDAAHVMSPMTGRGFVTGVEDAAVLANLLAHDSSQETVRAALTLYEAERLPFVRSLVTHSSRISRDFLGYAKDF